MPAFKREKYTIQFDNDILKEQTNANDFKFSFTHDDYPRNLFAVEGFDLNDPDNIQVGISYFELDEELGSGKITQIEEDHPDFNTLYEASSDLVGNLLEIMMKDATSLLEVDTETEE